MSQVKHAPKQRGNCKVVKADAPQWNSRVKNVRINKNQTRIWTKIPVLEFVQLSGLVRLLCNQVGLVSYFET